jgi:hypothetical protein
MSATWVSSLRIRSPIAVEEGGDLLVLGQLDDCVRDLGPVERDDVLDAALHEEYDVRSSFDED